MRSVVIVAPLLIAGCVAPVEQAAPPAPAARVAPLVAPAGNPAVGGTSMPVDASIADLVAAAPPLAMLTRALVAAGLGEALRGGGPFTLFAPTDAAFARLQAGTTDALMKSENRAALVRLLNLHLVAERIEAAELRRRIDAGNGRATLTTVAGEALTLTVTSGVVTLTDAGGNRGYVETADVRAANGVLHVVNGVLVPRLN